MPVSDKMRRQRELDRLAFEVLAAQHTEWTRWTDWFELTKARRPGGLGDDTFCQAVKRLLNEQKIEQSQIAKNRFYRAIFTSRSLPEVTPTPDVAMQALAFLLSRKPSTVV
jgi:hypothetical protein